jgi:succinate dehydrogenase/fumarate reductase flavoprotein subunit
MNESWEVVVIGAGAAGLAAAVSAGREGAKVLLVESERHIGGSMILSGGVFTVAGTSVQAALGIDDTADAFFRDYMDLNGWQLRPGLIRSFCEEAASTFEWMIGLGLEVPAKLSANGHQPGLRRVDVERTRRGHVPAGEGLGMAEVLERAMKETSCDVVLSTRVERLLVDDGWVSGAIVDGLEVRSRAVIVASGGFAHNPALLGRYFPPAIEAGVDLFVVAAPGSRGDHISLGEQAGAEVVGQGWGTMLLGAQLQRHQHWQAGFPPIGHIVVDRRGRRFMDENGSYAVVYGNIKRVGGSGWMIFDEAARAGLDPVYADWTPQNVAQQVAAGRIATADDLAALATTIGADPQTLEATVERWNTTLPATGVDPEFLRHESMGFYGYPTPDPIAMPPFYAARYLPTQLVLTQTGLQIDESARVMSPSGRPIPGLFAAGEAGGGILGPHYVGGMSIANALTMGRRAGLSAAQGR